EAEALARILSCREQMEAGAAVHFVARLRDASSFVGWTSAWPAEGDDGWEMGFWLAERCQGGGLGLEAASTLMAHLIAAIRPPRLRALVLPDNLRSIAILRRLGLAPA